MSYLPSSVTAFSVVVLGEVPASSSSSVLKLVQVLKGAEIKKGRDKYSEISINV